jgi:hypothetical protein
MGFPSKLWLYFGLIMVRKNVAVTQPISDAAQKSHLL